MKIKADYANAPMWKDLTVKSSLPEELKCLDEIAHNMWWGMPMPTGAFIMPSATAATKQDCGAP